MYAKCLDHIVVNVCVCMCVPIYIRKHTHTHVHTHPELVADIWSKDSAKLNYPKQNYFLWAGVNKAGLRKEYNSRGKANWLEM